MLTRRAGAEACRRVCENARPVPGAAEEMGVCWWTMMMDAVVEHGTPLVDDLARVGPVAHLGVDDTSFLKANRHHATIYATGLVDLQQRIAIDRVQGNAAADLRRWTINADPAWLAGIGLVATDLGGGTSGTAGTLANSVSSSRIRFRAARSSTDSVVVFPGLSLLSIWCCSIQPCRHPALMPAI